MDSTNDARADAAYWQDIADQLAEDLRTAERLGRRFGNALDAYYAAKLSTWNDDGLVR